MAIGKVRIEWINKPVMARTEQVADLMSEGEVAKGTALQDPGIIASGWNRVDSRGHAAIVRILHEKDRNVRRVPESSNCPQTGAEVP